MLDAEDSLSIGRIVVALSIGEDEFLSPFFILIFLLCIKMKHYGFSRKSI